MNRYIALMAALGLMAAFSSCKDDPEEIDRSDEPEEIIEPLPVEDLLSERVSVPTAVVGSEFDPVTTALINRLQSRQTEITDGTRAVIIASGSLSTMADDEKEAVGNVFDSGGCIVLSEPDARMAYEFSLSLGETPSFSPEDENGHANGHFCDVYVFNNHNDEYFVQDIHDAPDCEFHDDCDAEGDIDADMEQCDLDDLTPYQYGLRADKLARWINENSEPHASRSRSSVSDMASAQRVAYDFYPTASHDKVSGKSGSYTIIYTITPLYSFSHHADYYAVHQEIIGSNSAMNLGNWKDGEYYYGFYLGKITNDHQLLTRSDTTPSSTVIQTTSPATTQNARQESVGMSFNIGGEVGLNTSGPSAGISGGISYSESYTVTMPDVSINNQCKSDGSHINARWEYNVADPAPKRNFWGDITRFENAPSVATNTIDVHNTWLWVITNPSDRYKMKCVNAIYYNYRHGKNHAFSIEYGTHTYWTTYTRWINLDPPKRTR